MEDLGDLLSRARAIRGDRRQVFFHAPSVKRYETTEFPRGGPCDFVPVSVTGSRCTLGCDHCQGRLLESMQEVGGPSDLVSLASRLARRGCTGLLVSGGAGSDGTVPLLPYVDAMAEIARSPGLGIVVHTGVVGEELARGLARARVRCAMIDVVGDAETMRSVLHLDSGPEVLERSLRLLEGQGVPTVPHVVCGLDHGRIRGEVEALRIIGRGSPSAVVLVVLDPLPGTPMEGVAPPRPEQVAEIMARARIGFPDVPVMLGCARPSGPYRREVDRYALMAGLDGIAFPAEGTVTLARDMGLEPRFAHTCCSLVVDAGSGCGP
jgi:uncharacterized radical SAM superfamily protein